MKTSWVKKACFTSLFLAFYSHGFSADHHDQFLDMSDVSVAGLPTKEELGKIIYSPLYAENLLGIVSRQTPKRKGGKSALKSFLITVGEYVGDYKATKENHEYVFKRMIDPFSFLPSEQLSPSSKVSAVSLFGEHRIASRIIGKDKLSVTTSEIDSELVQTVSRIESHTSVVNIITSTNDTFIIHRLWKDVAACFWQDRVFYRSQKFIKNTDLLASTADIYTIYHVFDLSDKFRIFVKKNEDDPKFLVLDPADLMKNYTEVTGRLLSSNS